MSLVPRKSLTLLFLAFCGKNATVCIVRLPSPLRDLKNPCHTLVINLLSLYAHDNNCS